jgi:hypothetical protein
VVWVHLQQQQQEQQHQVVSQLRWMLSQLQK